MLVGMWAVKRTSGLSILSLRQERGDGDQLEGVSIRAPRSGARAGESRRGS